ncbi:MAG: T9SS type A sorting domain-containing protein [Deferribacteres bacterium]|nr:T9SS type A sorting domain-containing protein [candidate division KSB1 bacterium]MCB9502229.1 T9SS type A sorting domain-containing protein [Deferribacteres bacterium]
MKIRYLIILQFILSFSLPLVVFAQQFTFIDSTFNDADWQVTQHSEFGGMQTVAQRRDTLSDFGDYRFMQHILPAPENDIFLGKIETAHVYQQKSYSPIEMGEIIGLTIQFDSRLLNLPWEQTFIRTYVLLEQDGILFRSANYQEIIADTTWRSATLTFTNPIVFVSLDGSAAKPDFNLGSPIKFGFWRANSRFRNTPISASDTLFIEHAIDNFSVSITSGLNDNPPVAFTDYFNISERASYFFQHELWVLLNDWDFDGDAFKIISVTAPEQGRIIRFTDSTIVYQRNLDSPEGEISDQFSYVISDGNFQDSGDVFIQFCSCPVECFRFYDQGNSNNTTLNKIRTDDTLDVELFRQFRDEVLSTTERGQALIDNYYSNSFELLNIFVFGSDLLSDHALAMIKMMQPPLRNLMQGDGKLPVSEALVDTINAFLQKIRLNASDSLIADINTTLVHFGSLDSLKNKSVRTVAEMAIGDSIATSVLQRKKENISQIFLLSQNYPNPLITSTVIRYSLGVTAHVKLRIFNLRGQLIATLENKVQEKGYYSVKWDRSTDWGLHAPSGIYFIRLDVEGFSQSIKLIVMN